MSHKGRTAVSWWTSHSFLPSQSASELYNSILYRPVQGRPWYSGSAPDYWSTARVYRSCTRGMLHNKKKYLISPGCPRPSIVLIVQNRGLKHQSFSISNTLQCLIPPRRCGTYHNYDVDWSLLWLLSIGTLYIACLLLHSLQSFCSRLKCNINCYTNSGIVCHCAKNWIYVDIY